MHRQASAMVVRSRRNEWSLWVEGSAGMHVVDMMPLVQHGPPTDLQRKLLQAILKAVVEGWFRPRQITSRF
jgi:hypothetical protein